MLDHTSITVSKLLPAQRFYDAVMAALGYPCVRRDASAIGYGLRNTGLDDTHSYISVLATGSEIKPDLRHWCFRAPNRLAVDNFHAAGLQNGGRDDGLPGIRSDYHPDYYAAFLLDPDGNRIEAVCHKRA